MGNGENNNEATLFGIYGRHSAETCPLNDRKTAERIVKWLEEVDLGAKTRECKIHRILGQYHSALEHTFLWIVEAEDPHLIQQFCIESPMVSFNELKIVPLITFDQVVETLKKVHGF